MNKGIRLIFLGIGISVWVMFNSYVVFSQTAEPSQNQSEQLSSQTLQLKTQLQLTDEQALKVEKVFKMAQSQAMTDRENFKESAVALIQMAKLRQQMVENHLSGVFNDQQKESYRVLNERKSRTEMEFFELKEGLILTLEQETAVKLILDKYASEGVEEGELGDERRRGGLHGAAQRDRNLRSNAGISGSRVNRGGAGIGMDDDITEGEDSEFVIQSIKDEYRKKMAAIGKVISESQQPLLKQIIAMKEQEMEKWIKSQKKQ